MKRTLIIISLLTLIGMACGRIDSDLKDRPNLLLISVDTLRADRLGCYGYGRSTSPNIDLIARQGVLFENAFSASPKTTPSHMSILTGLYPRAHNVYMWEMNPEGVFSGKTLSEKINTLAEILKEYGYTNVAFTGGANVAGRIGFDRGFEIYDEEADTEAACRWLEENGEKKFFLFYHTYYTHDPYLPPPPYDTKYDPGYSGSIPTRQELMDELGIRDGEAWHGIWRPLQKSFWSGIDLNDPADRRHLNALYDGAINYVDNELISSLIKSMEKSGLLDNTLIVFTSDHGEEFLEHGRVEHNSIYREVASVPLIMRLPGILPAGKRIQQLVRTIDIMPTILELLKIPSGTSIQGADLLPAIMADRDLNLTAAADFNDYAPPVIESIREGNWFLLMDQRQTDSREQEQTAVPPFYTLYNTGEDPGEINDVSTEFPEVAAQLRKSMRRQRIESSKKHAEEAADQKPARMDIKNLERLKALGYL